MQVRMPRKQRVYAVMADGGVGLVLGSQGYDDGDPVAFLMEPGGEPTYGRDADVILYVGQPGIADGSAFDRLLDEHGLRSPDEPRVPLGRAEAWAAEIVGRIRSLDDVLGDE